MSDLPQNSLLQQRHARPVSGEELEMLGKRAAASWSEGECCSLTCAVTCAVKHASVPLSPEQVRRVVEFANTEAYLKEFKKEGEHKIVDFGPDGPANPADVLRDLNDGGGVTVMDSGLGDYRRPPEEKRASAESDESAFYQAFLTKTAGAYPEHNPFSDVIELRDKVAGAYDHVTAEISGLEVAYMDLSERLYGQVKQAAMEGISLGEIVQAWSTVTDEPEFVKAAFDQFVPRLFNDGVFRNLDEMGNSIVKTAGAKYVNVNHPLVGGYNDFCQTLYKLSGLRAYQEELYATYNQATGFLSEVMRKEAAGVGSALSKADKAVQRFAKKRLGMGDISSSLAGKAAVYGPIVGGAVGAGKLLHDAAEDAGVAYDARRQQRQARWAGMGGY